MTNTYRIALESARTEEFVRMVNVCVEMDTVANSVSKKVSDYPLLIIFFSVSVDFGGSNLLTFISIALIIATLATAHVARNLTKKA